MVCLSLLLITGMAAETACKRELTKLVADHILSNVNRDKFVSVMNCNSVSYKIRRDH